MYLSIIELRNFFACLFAKQDYGEIRVCYRATYSHTVLEKKYLSIDDGEQTTKSSLQ